MLDRLAKLIMGLFVGVIVAAAAGMYVAWWWFEPAAALAAHAAVGAFAAGVWALNRVSP